MQWSVGTSGYSYKEWKGPFYPEKIKPADMLAFYGERLSAVEINNTFYRMPKKSVLENWADQVPESFRFAIKASRRITHFKRLKETGEETGYLLEATKVLGDRLGVVLFQLPPNMKANVERLDGFLDILPDGLPAAFEFRHESWADAAVYERLRARNFARVVVDAADDDSEEQRDQHDAQHHAQHDAPELIRTADWGYLRLRRPDYDRADLARWAGDIRACQWDRAFVFFKHEDEGAGPRMAAEFTAVAREKQPRKAATARSRIADAEAS